MRVILSVKNLEKELHSVSKEVSSIGNEGSGAASVFSIPLAEWRHEVQDSCGLHQDPIPLALLRQNRKPMCNEIHRPAPPPWAGLYLRLLQPQTEPTTLETLRVCVRSYMNAVSKVTNVTHLP